MLYALLLKRLLLHLCRTAQLLRPLRRLHMHLWQTAHRRRAGCDMATRSSAALGRLLLLDARRLLLLNARCLLLLDVPSRSETASLGIDKR